LLHDKQGTLSVLDSVFSLGKLCVSGAGGGNGGNENK
jgi:hypothetical protein